LICIALWFAYLLGEPNAMAGDLGNTLLQWR